MYIHTYIHIGPVSGQHRSLKFRHATRFLAVSLLLYLLLHHRDQWDDTGADFVTNSGNGTLVTF
jgi:hypothetical protein